MDSATIDSMCRCCAAEGIFKDIKTSYHWMGEEEVYGDMLRECFDVKLATVEEGGICEVCITQLRNAANFKKQVLHTEKKFKRHLENQRFKATEVKEEVSADNGNSSDDDRGGDSEDDEDYVPDFEIPIKTESQEDPKSRKRAAKATTSRAKKSRVDEEKSVDVSDHKEIKSEVHNSWGVTIVKVKGLKADDGSTKLNKTETSQQKKSQSKTNAIKSEVTFKKIKVNQNEQVTNKCQKAYNLPMDIQMKPVTTKTKVNEQKKAALKLTNTPTQRIIINPPPDFEIAKKTKTSSSSKVLAKPRQILNVKSTPKDAPIQRTKLILPPDMDFMMELDKHRFNIRTMMQFSNATPIRNHVKSGFVCCFCDAHFLKPTDLKLHTIHTHNNDESIDKFFRKKAVLYSFMVKMDITSLICNLCHQTPDTLEQLISHLNDAHQKALHTDIKNHIVCFKFDSDNNIMKCLVCSMEFNSFKLLSEHMNQHYTNFICDECGVGFINRRQLLLHSDKHKVGEHKCGSCDKVFTTMRRMRTHERVTHIYNSGQGTHGYRCMHCDEKFRNRKAKSDHVSQVHGM